MKTKNILPNVGVTTVEEYFALPKNKREKYGLYLKPYALPLEWFEGPSGDPGWDTWSKRIRQEYPIQGFVREWLLTYDNPVYAFFGLARSRYVDAKYAVRNFFKPALRRWRACLPRHKSADVSEMIERSNFALLQDFYHEEMSKNIVNFSASESDQEFSKFVTDAIQWIELDRQKTLDDIDAAFDAVEQKRSNRKKGDPAEQYDVMYADVKRHEKLLEDTDSKILHNIVKYRKHFWT